MSVSAKVPSTPKDPSVGFLENLERLVAEARATPEETQLLVHGTTVATNSIIEGKTAKTALITTKGFRDLLEVQFQIRPKLYDVFVTKPTPDRHEREVGSILAQECPLVSVTLSSDLCPSFREYPRASTTSINACIVPIVGRYLERIGTGLRKRGFACEWYLMQSNGGVLRSDIAAREPCRIIESGPAAGVIVSSQIAKQIGEKNALCIDMGGTTAKVGMILAGEPTISSEIEVGAAAFSRSTARRASGYPLRTPSIDLVEIGAGGGSIAWIDSGGILRVGPRSAGADPGPACYPSGGEEPTVTDANLVLGRLNSAYFLGGEMALSTEAAREAIRKKCGARLGYDVEETAAAVVDLAVSNMVNAIRFISVERGHDPRDFCLITTGGAGPLHSNMIAAEIGIPRVVMPPSPGVASALGLLLTDVKQEVSRTVIGLKGIDWNTIRSIVEELLSKAQASLREQGIEDARMEFRPAADMRYAGQSFELNVPIQLSGPADEGMEILRERFHREHERAYGFSVRGEETVVVNLKVTGVGKMPHRAAEEAAGCGWIPGEGARKGNRDVYFRESGGMTSCAIYDRYRLLCENEVAGPAIVEETDSTTVVIPGYRAKVDEYGNLIIYRPDSSSGSGSG
ncbi:MAG: hydantoinase/oxoprolinase family protein [Candidatus Eisenbacteria bacterium]|nr:hydantoinase/oxoprolinase family protein [Candidatus Eisenbacteria bacterium]